MAEKQGLTEEQVDSVADRIALRVSRELQGVQDPGNGYECTGVEFGCVNKYRECSDATPHSCANIYETGNAG